MVSASNQRMSSTRVVEASVSEEDDSQSDGSEGSSASKSSIRRLVITEKAPTRAFSWLKAATTAFTFKTLLRNYVKQGLNMVSRHKIRTPTQV